MGETYIDLLHAARRSTMIVLCYQCVGSAPLLRYANEGEGSVVQNEEKKAATVVEVSFSYACIFNCVGYLII